MLFFTEVFTNHKSFNKTYPIKKLHGPSQPQMVGEQSILDEIEEKVMENMEKRIIHEIGRILK